MCALQLEVLNGHMLSMPTVSCSPSVRLQACGVRRLCLYGPAVLASVLAPHCDMLVQIEVRFANDMLGSNEAAMPVQVVLLILVWQHDVALNSPVITAYQARSPLPTPY